MDPILLFLVRFVILVFFLFVTSLVLWVRSVVRERNECRLIIAFLKRKPQEKSEYSQERDIAVNNLVDFALAYYKRTRARGEKKVESANTAMATCWRKLSDDSQEKLAVLGGLANLRVGDNFSK